MKSKKYNVVIIGSGFSGIVAANKLVGKGLTILMIDENFHVGGQLLRKIPEKLGKDKNYKPDYIKKVGMEFVSNIKGTELDILNNTSVIGIYDNNEILIEVEKSKVESVNYDMILFATGARERYLPFKGWTLPGVFSAGMAQVMMKTSGVLPAKDIVVGGSGLFLFSAAYELLKNGANVLSVFESGKIIDKMQMFPTLMHYPSKISEGVRYVSKILTSRVPIRHKTRIIEARGRRSVEEVVVVKTDNRGKMIPGKEKVIKTGGVALSYGFVPNIELPNLAGCDLKFERSLGGWIADVNENMESSVKGIYCAGEITGIGGALKSINEGEIAAHSILLDFAKGNRKKLVNSRRKLIKARKHHLNFSKYFNTLYGIRNVDIEFIPDEAIVCRCEDVKMGDIRKAVENGFTSPGALKTYVRAGMGNCQGRTCGPIIYDMLNIISEIKGENFTPFSKRPPLKPVKIRSLINNE